MLAPFLIIGTIFFCLRWACLAAPPSRTYSVLIAIVGMVASLPLGLIVGGTIGFFVTKAEPNIGLDINNFIGGGMVWGMVGFVSAPFIVFYYRRMTKHGIPPEPRTTRTTKPAFENLKRKN